MALRNIQYYFLGRFESRGFKFKEIYRILLYSVFIRIKSELRFFALAFRCVMNSPKPGLLAFHNELNLEKT